MLKPALRGALTYALRNVTTERGIVAGGTPTVTGIPFPGEMLVASGGTGGYQWRKDGVNIPGATSAGYVVDVRDIGSTITVVRSGTPSANTVIWHPRDIPQVKSCRVGWSGVQSDAGVEAVHGATVNRWVDLINGWVLSQTTEASKPVCQRGSVGTNDTVFFDGVNDSMASTSPGELALLSGVNFGGIIVSCRDTTPNGGTTVHPVTVHSLDGSNNVRIQVGTRVSGTAAASTRSRRLASDTISDLTDTSVFVGLYYNVLESFASPVQGGHALYVNGEQRLSGTYSGGAGPFPVASSTVVSMGLQGSASYFPGHVACEIKWAGSTPPEAWQLNQLRRYAGLCAGLDVARGYAPTAINYQGSPVMYQGDVIPWGFPGKVKVWGFPYRGEELYVAGGNGIPQWFKNGVAIPGANQYGLIIDGLPEDTYFCRIGGEDSNTVTIEGFYLGYSTGTRVLRGAGVSASFSRNLPVYRTKQDLTLEQVAANTEAIDWIVALATWRARYEAAATNTLPRSETFANGGWALSNVTRSSVSQVSPALQASSTFLLPATTSTAKNMNCVAATTAGTPYTISCFAKASGIETVIQVAGSNGSFQGNAWANFDLTGAGAVGSVGSAVIATTIIPLANGWYRCAITVTATATQNVAAAAYYSTGGQLIGPRAPVYAGDGTSGLFIWGTQMETGGLSSYIATDDLPVTRPQETLVVTGASWFMPQGVFRYKGGIYPGSISSTSVDRNVLFSLPTSTQMNLRLVRGSSLNPAFIYRDAGNVTRFALAGSAPGPAETLVASYSTTDQAQFARKDSPGGFITQPYGGGTTPTGFTFGQGLDGYMEEVDYRPRYYTAAETANLAL